MTDHELLHPDAIAVHKQHAEADDDVDYICPGDGHSDIYVLPLPWNKTIPFRIFDLLEPPQNQGEDDHSWRGSTDMSASLLDLSS